VRSALARSVLQQRAFLELARVVAAGDVGMWTGAIPVLIAPSGASWGAAYRVHGNTLELAASEGVPIALRNQLETFELGKHGSFAACKAVRSRRPVTEEHLFSGVVAARSLAALESAGLAAGTAVPLVCGGAAVGVLVVGTSTREGVDVESLAFLDAAASFLAPALVLAEGSRHPGSDRTGPAPRTTTSSSPPRKTSSAPPPRKVADVDRVVMDAVQQASSVLRRAGVDARVEAGDGEHFAAGDPNDLRLAIAHLVINAAEAAAERAPVASAPTVPRRVRVTVSREGGAIAVCVDDSGRGVPHDLRARVFEPGFSTKGKGRGAGLATVRQLALDHGGHVEIGASDLGGASFRLLLPMSNGRPEAAPKRRHSSTWPQLAVPGADVAIGDVSGDDEVTIATRKGKPRSR
jgi:anti-sigma regulatory factor (Ser/Thr protein kinase)